MNIINDRKILNQYMKEIRFNLLSIEEEKKLSYIIQNNSVGNINREKAIHKLIIHNLRFVINVAKQYIGKGLQLNDLIEEGNIGLYEAAKKYNYEKKKTKFITYAVYWIKQSILFALSVNVRTVRLPLNINNKYNEYRKIKNEMIINTGEYDIEEIAEKMIVPKNDVYDLEKYVQRGLSFDDPVSNEEDSGKTRIDMFIEIKEIDKYEKEHTKLKLQSALNKLDERDKNIIMDFYGIDRDYPLSREDLEIKYYLQGTMINKIIRDTRDILKYLLMDE